jgi:bifunctional non-homologous end joining protein LigD
MYMAFDLLYLEGLDLRARPLADRRWRLERAIEESTHVLPARRLPDHGLMAWELVKQRGYEGLVAKDERSPYRPGPTRSWLKVKVRYEGVFTVGGLVGTPEACEGVLVGERVGRRLVYRGTVEWGVGRATVAELLEQCPVAKASPFREPPKSRRVTWLEPRARITVTYNELMEGRLRDPVFRGIASRPAKASSNGG